MKSWRELYAARDWDALENWWRACDDTQELQALFEQLARDVPPEILVNGMEERPVALAPSRANPGWEGAAEILFLGELEAKIQETPPDERMIWGDLTLEVGQLMAALVQSGEEPTTGAKTLSRSAHAQASIDYLEQVDREAEVMVQELDPDGLHPDDRDWLRSVIAQAALASFRAGVHAQAANGKTIEAHAVRTGQPCKNKVIPGKLRCKHHGGKSTGPRTPEGKARIANAQKKRWEKWRAQKAADVAKIPA